MKNAGHYRDQAARARRLARGARDDIEQMLMQIAREYDDIAEDLENGAIEVRHPDLMPQNQK